MQLAMEHSSAYWKVCVPGATRPDKPVGLKLGGRDGRCIMGGEKGEKRGFVTDLEQWDREQSLR